MDENLHLENDILNESLDEDLSESFKSFSLEEFSNEVSNHSGVDSSSVRDIIQAFVQINLKNLKLR